MLEEQKHYLDICVCYLAACPLTTDSDYAVGIYTKVSQDPNWKKHINSCNYDLWIKMDES
jgi:hypothetical protein